MQTPFDIAMAYRDHGWPVFPTRAKEESDPRTGEVYGEKTPLTPNGLKAATTGTGLRTVWIAEVKDAGAALDWAYERDPARFTELVQDMANAAVRAGMRDVPGFLVREEKVAR